MQETPIVTSEKFSLKFSGDNSIEAGLLGLALSNMAFIVAEIAKSAPIPPEVQFRVEAFKEGSFEAAFEVIMAAVDNILPYLPAASTIVLTIKGIFEIKKLINGEKPKSVSVSQADNIVHVELPDGTKVAAPESANILFINQAVDRKVSEIAKAAMLHDPDGGFQLITEESTETFTKEDTQAIATPQEFTEYAPTSSENETQVTLPIKSLDLLGGAAWTFKHGGRTIRAKIEDANFLRLVHSGETTYKAGDKLEVLLETRSDIASDGTLTRETFTIKRVYRHVSAPEQIGLF